MYKDEIKQTYSNIELFQLFMKQKAILLFLLQEEILAIDQPIASLMNKYKYDSFHYPLFYFPEIKPFEHKRRLHDLQKEVPENLEEIRKIGENDSELCKIIRKDSVEEFIAYINITKTKLDEKIDPSINETNHFLIKNKPELIEYAAFYGSIEIIKYLQSQNIELKPSLWLYSIHSNKIEMIQFLEENKVEPEDKTYEKCLKESVKCHHNDIANYIKEKYVKEEEVNYFKGKRFNVNVLIVYAFYYYNYNYFPKGLHNHFCMSYLCQYDYYELIELLLKMKKINVNVDVVLLYFFLELTIKYVL